MDNITEQNVYCSAGLVKVTVGDKFKWNGIHPGDYEVLSFSGGNIYSPSGLGGTCTVIVKNLKTNEEIEWCGDSVAAGIHYTKTYYPTYFNHPNQTT